MNTDGHGCLGRLLAVVDGTTKDTNHTKGRLEGWRFQPRMDTDGTDETQSGLVGSRRTRMRLCGGFWEALRSGGVLNHERHEKARKKCVMRLGLMDDDGLLWLCVGF